MSDADSPRYRKFEFNHYSQLFFTHYERCTGFNAYSFSSAPTAPEHPFIINLNKFLYIPEHLSVGFSAFGCIGFENAQHKTVARNFSNNEAARFNVLLGDIIYPNGVQRDGKHNMSRFFDSIYTAAKPTFGCLGNHDYNYHGPRPDFEMGPNNALQLVEHSYRNFDRTKFHMPFRYYGLSLARTFIFVLDSNTLPWDLDQQNWLTQTSILLQRHGFNGKIVIMQHHPLLTYGKRMIKHDAQLYFQGGYKHGSFLLPKYRNMTKGAALPSLSFEIQDIFYRRNIKFNFLMCSHDHYSDCMVLDNGALQIVSTPNWPHRDGKMNWLSGSTHTPESEIVKKILGYKETVFQMLNKKLSYVVYREPAATETPVYGPWQPNPTLFFHNAETDTTIPIPVDAYQPTTMNIAQQLNNFLTGNVEGANPTQYYRGLGEHVPRTIAAMQLSATRPVEGVTPLQSPPRYFGNGHSPVPEINIIGLLEDRFRNLSSIGKEISSKSALLMRWSHIRIHNRHPAINGFYYYLPHILHAMWRRHEYKTFILDDTSHLFAQLRQLFANPTPDPQIARLIQFPGYGGTPDSSDLNDEI